MGKAKIKELSLTAIEALKAIIEVDKPITAIELKNAGLENLNSAHLKALENRGLITAEPVFITVMQPVKRKVNQYTITVEGANVEFDEKEGE